jgi:N-acetylmuramoyl-L-alanine amidase
VALVGVFLAVAPVAAAPPRELRTIEVRHAGADATVALVLSRPGNPSVRAIRDESGALLRLSVDLPAGTTVAAAARRMPAVEPPIAAVRIGLVDADRVRVVVDLDGARDFRVDRDGEPGTIVLAVAGEPERESGRAEPARPGAPELTPAPPVERRATRHRVRPRIVLDPGHGGDDPGAEGYAVEKAVTLDVARRLAGLLRERLGAEVVLTRDRDETLALKDRTARANAEGADLFVSIHANANPTGRLRGVETYYLDNAADHATARLAKMENGLDLLHPRDGEPGLRYILSDLVQVGKVGESARLARSLQHGLVSELRLRHPGVVDLGVKRGPFYVLVGAYMPCVLVEAAFLTHPVEGRRLARADYRQDVAHGLYDGIARYVGDSARRRTL